MATGEWWDLGEMIAVVVAAMDSVSQAGVDPNSDWLAVIRAGDAAGWLADQPVQNGQTSLDFPERHQMARELAAIGGIDDIDQRLRPVEV
jgi:hypothetical protein